MVRPFSSPAGRRGMYVAALALPAAALILLSGGFKPTPVTGNALAAPTAPELQHTFPARLARHYSEDRSLDRRAYVLRVEPLLPDPRLPASRVSTTLPPYELVIPVDGVEMDDLVDSFAQARGSQRRHLAIDIPAPVGTPVLAATAGTVLRKHTSARGGITLYLLDDSGDYVYYYAHLDGYATGLAPGQDVEQGQLIGYVGHTGNAPEDLPHLHFAIWHQEPGSAGWGGRAVNPYRALTR